MQKRYLYWGLATGALILLLLVSGVIQAPMAQNAASPDKAGSATGSTTDSTAGAKESPWSVQCLALSRDALPDCTIEQRAIVTQTGRLLMQISIRVPAETRKPFLTVQGPLGTYLPAGITLDVDGTKFQELAFQACEANGCFAGTPLSEEQLAMLFKGGKLNVIVQSATRQPVAVPMSLIGFTDAFRKIE